MRIKRLEIYGFKSFPYRVVLPFPPGISAIVGPNGSGKSNIVDALRWVLGEQSLKKLRVRSAEDLLFAGDHGEAPGFAEVRLVLENDGQAPEGLRDLPEIVVARRLYRSGESEFLLNHRACRLKDIHYLFLDTGVHPRGYGLIDQGEVGRFLEWSPEERRFFLEELAGISRYRVRREEARRNLEHTRENLTRVEDLLAELNTRRQELQEQAQLAREYRKLREEFQRLALTRLAILYLRAQKAKEKAEDQLQKIVAKITLLEKEEKSHRPGYQRALTETHLLKRRLREKEEELREKEKKREELSRKLRTLYQEEGQLSRELEREKTREETLTEEIQRLEVQKKNLIREREALSQTLKEKRAQQEESQRNYQTLQKRLQEEEKILREAEARILSLQEKLRFAEAERKRLHQEVAFLASKEKDLKEKASRLVQQREKLLQETTELTERLAWVESQRAALSKEIESRLRIQKELEAQLRILEEEGQSLKHERQALLKEKEALEAAILRLFPADLRDLCKRGGLRVLADLLPLSPESRTWAEALLAERLTFPVIEDPQELQLLARVQELSGVFVATPETLRGLQELLQSVKEADHPRILWEHLPKNPVIFPEKELIFEPPGFLKAQKKSGPGVLEIKDRLREISSLLATLSSKMTELAEKKEELRERINELQREGEARVREIQKREREARDLARSLSQAQKALERLRQEATFLQREKGEIRCRKEEAQKEMALKEKEIAVLREKLEELLSQEAPRREALSHLRQEVQKEGRSLEERAREVAELSGRLKILQERQKELEVALSRARERQERASQRKNLLSEEWRFVRETLQKVQAERRGLEEDLKKKLKELENLKKRYTELQDFLRQQEEEEKARSREKERLQERKHKLEIDRLEAEMTLEHLRKEAQEVHEMNLETFLAQEPPAEKNLSRVEEALREIREKLAAFPPVNLAAEEELHRVEERWNFLTERQKELLAALADLEKALERLDAESRRLLKEALQAANNRLKEVFPLLFEGGQAELYLTHSGDPLSAGLDLRVKLPGKPVKHLTMLSGGEKALCALAVLFAFYLVKPGPFCILDEVEASLDEANTLRFNALLQRLKERSQVILVTHNPRVMEVADALFGVTMEEEGISKVVSLKLEETPAKVRGL